MYVRTEMLKSLSPRQQEAVGLVSLGYTYQQSADLMGINTNTLANHIQLASAKLRDKTIILPNEDIKLVTRRNWMDQILVAKNKLWFIIPGLPPSWNNAYPNSPGGRGRYPSKQTKAWKAVAIAAIKEDLTYADTRLPFEGRCGLMVVLHVRSRGKWDLDNREKLVSDVMTESGVWKDDSQVDCIVIKSEVNADTMLPLPSVEAVVWEEY